MSDGEEEEESGEEDFEEVESESVAGTTEPDYDLQFDEETVSRATNQNSLFRSRDWLTPNQGPVFPDLAGSCNLLLFVSGVGRAEKVP